jgi:hypothetical protein
MRKSVIVGLSTVLVAVACVGMPSRQSGAEDRPAAPYLLPEETLVYVRVADSRDLAAQFQETAIGRMLQDEELKPLLKHLYGSAVDAFTEIEEQVGLSLPALLEIPQGEACLAVVASENGPPAVILLLEVGDRLRSANVLLDRGKEALVAQGATVTTEMVGDTSLAIYQMQGGRQRRVVQCERDGVVILASDVDATKNLLSRWDAKQQADDKNTDGNDADGKNNDDPRSDDEKPKALVDNSKFMTIMSSCRRSDEEKPQLTWFVDPIELARAATGNSGAGRAGLALLPVLGLDGLHGVGGSVLLADEEFDTIAHIHVLLDSPRAGIIKMVAFESGDTTPEPWVPGDVASYLTLNWDVDQTYRAAGKLYDSFFGEDMFKTEAQQRIGAPLDLDFEKDVLGAVSGRFTLITWFEKPARLNSRSMLAGVQLKDAMVTQKKLDETLARFPDRFEKETFGRVTYYRANVEGRIARPADGGRPADGEPPAEDEGAPGGRVEFRRPEPCLAILGDYLIATDSQTLLREAILTNITPARSLSEQLDYKLIASKVGRQPGGDSPAMVTFRRPEQEVRLLYDLIASETNRQRIAAGAENNRFLKAVNDALEENPLPPFSVLADYLAPGGGMMTNDETGLHYMAFTLKRE